MSAAISTRVHQSTLEDANWVRWTLITISLGFMVLFLCVPLVLVIIQAFSKGFSAYFSALSQPDMQAAMRLTLLTAFITVPLNTVFGVAAAWAITRFEFRGKDLLITLIDLPFSVSPVISGLIFVLMFGAQGWFGSWFVQHDIKIIFAVPGIVLATLFITFPFVARQLIPLIRRSRSYSCGPQRCASVWRRCWAGPAC